MSHYYFYFFCGGRNFDKNYNQNFTNFSYFCTYYLSAYQFSCTNFSLVNMSWILNNYYVTCTDKLDHKYIENFETWC